MIDPGIEPAMTTTDSENLTCIRAALDAVATVEVVTQDLAERRNARLRDILSRPWAVDRFGRITAQSFEQIDRELLAVGLRIARDDFGKPRYDDGSLNVEEV